jgi:hypothetical protein
LNIQRACSEADDGRELGIDHCSFRDEETIRECEVNNQHGRTERYISE